jgi:hypothetical protein
MQAPGPIIASFGRDCPLLRVHTASPMSRPLSSPASPLARPSLSGSRLACLFPSVCLPSRLFSSPHRHPVGLFCSVQSTASKPTRSTSPPLPPGLALFALLRPPPGVRESARTPTHFRTPGAHRPPPPPFHPIHPNLSPSFVLSPALLLEIFSNLPLDDPACRCSPSILRGRPPQFLIQ